MTGKRRANSDISRFVITDLPYHQHLRILTQQVSGSFGKIQTDLLSDLRLHDPGDNLFHWIFDGDDMTSAETRQLTQTTIDRSCFAAARRPGQQHQPGSLAQKTPQLIHDRLRESQLLQCLISAAAEKSENNFLSGNSRIGSHTNVAARVDFSFLDAPVLREGFLISF